jgi:hypothetical protein
MGERHVIYVPTGLHGVYVLLHICVCTHIHTHTSSQDTESEGTPFSWQRSRWSGARPDDDDDDEEEDLGECDTQRSCSSPAFCASR